MEIIEIPHEHALVELDSIEIRALWQALGRARDSMDNEAFTQNFNMSPNRASDLGQKLSEALRVAQDNLLRD